MDLKGSLIDTNIRIYPSQKLIDFIKTISVDRATPYNIAKLAKCEDFSAQNTNESVLKPIDFELNKKDIENINKIKNIVESVESTNSEETEVEPNEKTKENNMNHMNTKQKSDDENESINSDENKNSEKTDEEKNSDKSDDQKQLNNKSVDDKESTDSSEIYRDEQHLVTSDIDWIYKYLKEKRNNGVKDVPFLHVLLQGVDVLMPDNKLIKRNPLLEERCVKLRAQQQAREYRKMTKSVDNVRMRYPEDSISYQLKQVNRQLIAIGQFILSIFAGFLFGFKGVEWMIGPMDFGFRLLLGVMCALIIALAEIYFLAKKINEELDLEQTVQLGGPPKLAEEPTCHGHKIRKHDKEHMD